MPQATVAKLMTGKEWTKSKYKNETLSWKHRAKEKKVNSLSFSYSHIPRNIITFCSHSHLVANWLLEESL
jgi:hypothetical protein